MSDTTGWLSTQSQRGHLPTVPDTSAHPDVLCSLISTGEEASRPCGGGEELMQMGSGTAGSSLLLLPPPRELTHAIGLWDFEGALNCKSACCFSFLAWASDWLLGYAVLPKCWFCRSPCHLTHNSVGGRGRFDQSPCSVVEHHRIKLLSKHSFVPLPYQTRMPGASTPFI